MESSRQRVREMVIFEIVIYGQRWIWISVGALDSAWKSLTPKRIIIIILARNGQTRSQISTKSFCWSANLPRYEYTCSTTTEVPAARTWSNQAWNNMSKSLPRNQQNSLSLSLSLTSSQLEEDEVEECTYRETSTESHLLSTLYHHQRLGVLGKQYVHWAFTYATSMMNSPPWSSLGPPSHLLPLPSPQPPSLLLSRPTNSRSNWWRSQLVHHSKVWQATRWGGSGGQQAKWTLRHWYTISTSIIGCQGGDFFDSQVGIDLKLGIAFWTVRSTIRTP